MVQVQPGPTYLVPVSVHFGLRFLNQMTIVLRGEDNKVQEMPADGSKLGASERRDGQKMK